MNKILFRKLLPYAIVFLGVAYGLWPLDVIPDIPLVGWLDDAGVLGTVIMVAMKLLSKKKPEKST